MNECNNEMFEKHTVSTLVTQLFRNKDKVIGSDLRLQSMPETFHY